MSRRTDRLVAEIRSRRRHARRAWSETLAMPGIGRSIRRSPLAWLAGGAAAGLLLMRFVVPPVVRRNRVRLRAGLRQKLGSALTTLLVAYLQARSEAARRGNGTGVDAPRPAEESSLPEPAPPR